MPPLSQPAIPGVIMVRTLDDAREAMARIDAVTVSAIESLVTYRDPHAAMYALKFSEVGRHPVDGHALNLIEQVNQTFTYLVALKAAEMLLQWHPESQGLYLAPGATMARPLDIMSVEPGLVGAETFAAVRPSNNGKLSGDLRKLAADTSFHRYVFFHAPGYAPGRQPKLETVPGVQVHCVAVRDNAAAAG